jgi:hypothetical protein
VGGHFGVPHFQQDRAVLDEDAAALLGAPHALDVVVVFGEPLAILLVRRETFEVDQRQRLIRRARELGRQPVADEIAAAPRDDAAELRAYRSKSSRFRASIV